MEEKSGETVGAFTAYDTGRHGQLSWFSETIREILLTDGEGGKCMRFLASLKKTTLYRKMLLLMVSALVVSYLTCFIMLAVAFTVQEQTKVRENIENTSIRIASNIENYLREIDMASNEVMCSTWVQQFFSHAGFDTDSELYSYRRNVKDFLGTFSMLNENLKCMVMVSHGYYVNSSNFYVDFNYRMEEQDWFYHLEETGKYRIFGNNPMFTKNSSERTFTSYYRIHSIYNQKPIGYFITNISYDHFKNLKQLLVPDEKILLKDAAGDIVYTDMSAEEIRELEKGNELYGQEETVYKMGSYLCCYDRVMEGQWDLWIRKDNATFLTGIRNNSSVFYFMIPIALIFMIASFLFSRYLTKPIVTCTEALREVRNENYDVVIPNAYHDEIGDMIDGFNDMASNIQRLLDLNKAMYKARQQTEFRILQQRINPHFLCNTLEIINGMILCGEEENALKLTGMLGTMYHYDLGESDLAYVSEELKYLKNYMAILAYKYRNLKVSYDIDEEVLEYRMPKFICQPMVENTFRHGFVNNRQDCRILISMKRKQEALMIDIRDNGSGIPEVTLEEIQLKIRLLKEDQTLPLEEHIGILNSARRIFLHYGKESVFVITSTAEKGTWIHMELSLQEKPS